MTHQPLTALNWWYTPTATPIKAQEATAPAINLNPINNKGKAGKGCLNILIDGIFGDMGSWLIDLH